MGQRICNSWRQLSGCVATCILLWHECASSTVSLHACLLSAASVWLTVGKRAAYCQIDEAVHSGDKLCAPGLEVQSAYVLCIRCCSSRLNCTACAARYFKLWEGQRKGPTSRYQDMDDVAAPAGGRGNRGGRGGAESPVVDESSKARAEAVVAAALAQVGS